MVTNNMSDTLKIKLNMRRTLSNNILIRDHPEFNIIISEKNKKITTFPKKNIDEFTFDHQQKFFNFLIDRGVIEPESVQGSLIYSGLEGKYEDNYETNSINQILLSISDFMIKYDLEDSKYKKYEEDYIDYVYNPSDEDTTELGEISQEKKKGSIHNHPYYFGNGLNRF